MAGLRGLRDQRRARELAGDARAGSWARGQARTTQREFLRERWRLYALFVAMVVVAAGLVSLSMPTDLLKGMVLGAAFVAGPAAIWAWTVQATGTAPMMMGDQAEQWTASELRKLARRGWRVINHFALGRGDIDHALIGPAGAYAVETKWSATSWQSEFGRDRLRDAVAQAQRNARILRLWQPLKSRDVPVQAVLVVWGLGASKWPEAERIQVIDGVTVIAGRALKSWTEQLGDGVLHESQVVEVCRAIDEQITRRDPHERLNHPQPLSLAEGAVRAGWAVGAAMIALVLFGQTLRWTDTWQWTVAISAVGVTPGLALIRAGSARPAAWGWTLGLALPAVALTAAELIDRLA